MRIEPQLVGQQPADFRHTLTNAEDVRELIQRDTESVNALNVIPEIPKAQRSVQCLE